MLDLITGLIQGFSWSLTEIIFYRFSLIEAGEEFIVEHFRTPTDVRLIQDVVHF